MSAWLIVVIVAVVIVLSRLRSVRVGVDFKDAKRRPLKGHSRSKRLGN